MQFLAELTVKQVAAAAVGLALALGGIGYGGYWYHTKTLSAKEQQLSSTQTELQGKTQELETTQYENRDLTEALERERDTNASFESQIRKIGRTVGTLEKLSQTDPELLQKYSKVYFLNENYVPAELASIPKGYLYSQAEAIQFHEKALQHLEDLMADAESDGLALQVISAYRSFGTQAQLKTSYRVVYGTGANRFSAEQGYSEHQLGTTVDFTTPKIGNLFAGFEATDEYAWLTGNAYRYGFILSYPKGNAFYQFEPWHWRFVGRDLARKLHREGKNFYDLAQREIDPYLVDLFD